MCLWVHESFYMYLFNILVTFLSYLCRLIKYSFVSSHLIWLTSISMFYIWMNSVSKINPKKKKCSLTSDWWSYFDELFALWRYNEFHYSWQFVFFILVFYFSSPVFLSFSRDEKRKSQVLGFGYFSNIFFWKLMS